MNEPVKSLAGSAVLDAIRAKREKRGGGIRDIAEVEASLLADIESFDLNEAERIARGEQLASVGGMADPTLSFPDIVPEGVARDIEHHSVPGKPADPGLFVHSSNLLGQLRHQAEERRRELSSERAVRSEINLAIDKTLKYVFFYFHDLVERKYTAAEDVAIGGLVWQEGFADYRTQPQSAGAMVEMVSLSCQFTSPVLIDVERDGPAVDRLRNSIFDYGLQFECKEYRNKRGYLERADFRIRGEVAISVRWRADFTNGAIVIEARNLERLGSTRMTLRPQAVDQQLLDQFGGLLLGLPNSFRELARR
jgi:hypothetical protein